MVEIKESCLPGCYELKANKFIDDRGVFVKTFHLPTFNELNLNTNFVEEYYSESIKGVIRGMHFQLPPYEHVKLVYCVHGNVMDVVVDLRKGSPTFGKYVIFSLSSDKANMIYIPEGMAHGFCVMSDKATMVYKVSTIYHPESDAGIRWDSIGVPWPVKTPLISQRDRLFPSLDGFNTPFTYDVS